MESLHQLIHGALEQNEQSLRTAEGQRQQLLNGIQGNTQIQLKETLEPSPEAQKVAERIDRLVLFQRLLRNIQMNLPQFEEGDVKLRPNQLRSTQKLIEFLQQEGRGGTTGYIKQPTGAGKTVLFGLVTRLCSVPSMILVPSTNLLMQTKKELIEVVGIPGEDIGLVGAGHKEYDRQISIVTYQSHRSRFSRDQKYRAMAESRQLVICDEAHRSLGKVTQDSLELLDGECDGLLTKKEEEAEDDVLAHLDRYTPSRALKIGFTATPQLALKNVEDAFGPIIAEEKHADLVRAKILVPYRIVQADGTVSDKDLESYMTLDKEVEILHREQAYKKLLGKYVDVLHEYQKTKKVTDYPMRGVAFCVRITECDRFAQEATELGLRARVLTSRETKGLNAEKAQDLLTEAEQQLTNGDIDIIVTVTKLAEGWDYPPANAVIWARASQSPALIMQGVGRTARTYTDDQKRKKEWSHVFETNWSLRGKSKGKMPLRIADALAQMRENPEECCTMMSGADLEYLQEMSVDDYRLLIQQQFTPQQWSEMSQKNKGALRIANQGLNALARLFGVEGNPVGNHSIHLMLGRAIWGEAFGDPEREEQEQVALLIKEQFTPQQWAGMNRLEKGALRIANQGLNALARLFDVKGDPASNHSVHLILGRAIWGEHESLKELSAEEIRSAIQQQFTPHQWAGMNRLEKGALRIANQGLNALARLFGVEGNPVGNHSIHLMLGRAIWGEAFGDPEREEQEQVALLIKEQFTPQQWSEMSQKNKGALRIANQGLNALATLSGVEGSPVQRHSVHLELGRAIWGEHESLKEFSTEELQSIIQQQFTPQQWAGMQRKEKGVLRFADRGLIALARLFGVEGNPVQRHSVHLELGRAIWGEVFGDPEREEQEQVALLIKEQFTPQQWAKMKCKEKCALRIANRGLFSLATLFGVEGSPVQRHSVHLELGRAIWGEAFGGLEK